MRIAIAGIATESCTFSALPTRLADFRITREADDAFTELYPFLDKYPDIDFVGTITAKALPGGPVEAAAYEAIKNELLGQLQSRGPFDGVYLDMHGAMNVAGMDDAEGDLYRSIREILGDDPLLSASYDLHGNVSDKTMATLDIITGFRTAPHIDALETRERAMSLLLRCLRQGIRPRKAFVRIPVAMPGEKTSTEWEPGNRIYEAIQPKIDGRDVIDATVQVGYVWADEPRMTACAIALGLNEEKIGLAARELAALYWKHRRDFRFGAPALSVDDCLRQAMSDAAKPVLLSDSGDNPTAGGAGDVTYFLSRALALAPPDMIYASIAEPAAVRTCIAAGLGAEVDLQIGGKLDRRNSQPLDISGTVESIKADPDNPQVVLKSGGIHIILTGKRTPFHRRQQFTDLNLKPEAHDIIAIKIGYLEPELKSMARASYLALSPGAVNQDITSLPFARIQRPCYPFDPKMDWEPIAQIF
ncbi:MAG: M81 family metallopeptidase [Chloroflexota bacterium]|nr:M81 family metallopeptidase [Chloroflexota bacterium]